MKKLYIILAILGLLTVANYYFIYKPYKKEKLAKTIILQETTKQQFLVIGKKIVSVEITKEENNEGIINQLLFGHVLKISGKVAVYFGLDLDTNQIELSYDYKKQCVKINADKPTVLTTEILFPISYKDSSGVVYKVLKQDKNKDLNDMLALLTQEAINQTEKWLQTQDTNEYIKELANSLNSKAGKNIFCE